MVFPHLATVADTNCAPYEPSDKINLWWDDYLHANRHGSYLSALVIFGTLTGISPWSFGASEKAVSDLGIGPGESPRSPLDGMLRSGMGRRPCARPP